MTITLHYAADYKALIDNAATEQDREAVEASYADYCKYLTAKGVEIDYDSNQTTYCWSGADEWPSDVKDFWEWRN